MARVDLVVESKVSRSSRARQLEGMFDVPASERSRVEWHGDVAIDAADWQVGLVVGPSGSGKSTVARELFGAAVDWEPQWGKASVIDDFDRSLSIEEIAQACQAVGFNTIPAWLRPYKVLSNGERFRVELARRLLEQPDPIVVDEFTSVVDRQVAKIGSHAVQKYCRKHARRFVAASCHYDIVDWLQPDWILEPATMTLARRRLRRRPKLECTIRPVHHAAWSLFAPYHYLTAHLLRNARCYCLFVEDRPASFAGVIFRQNLGGKNIRGISRVVTLPDWQGLGLAFVLMDTLGGLYKACGYRLRMYPAHPALVRAADRSPVWRLCQRPDHFRNKSTHGTADYRDAKTRQGSRPNAVFEYCGPAHPDRDLALGMTGVRERRL